MKNILHYVERNLKHNNPLWNFPGENRQWPLSYIVQQGQRIGRVLFELGIAAGDRVGIQLGNQPEFIPLLLGIWYANAVAVPLRSEDGKKFDISKYLLSIQNTCRLSLLVVSNDVLKDNIGQWEKNTQSHIIRIEDLLHLIRDVKDGIEIPETMPGDIAVIQYSSGSTGAPKGVVVTHEMIIKQVKEINSEFYENCRGHIIRSSASWLPFNHDMGLFIGILNPLFLGADNLLASPRYYMVRPHRWLKLMGEYRANINFTTNTAMLGGLRLFQKMAENDPPDLSDLHIYLAAEKVSAKLLKRLYEVFAPMNFGKNQFHIGYGMAENALGAASTKTDAIVTGHFNVGIDDRVTPAKSTDTQAIELVSVGRAHTGTSITIRDSEDQLLHELSVGEICIDGPCVTPGYFNDAAATAKTLRNGILHTGDLGFFYEDELYFLTRQDDMIVIGGRNIIPEDVEAVVEELPFIRNAALFAIDKQLGMEIVLLVEHKRLEQQMSFEEDRRNLQRRIMEELDLLLPTIHFCRRNSIERTSSGKKRRKIVGARFAVGDLQTY